MQEKLSLKYIIVNKIAFETVGEKVRSITYTKITFYKVRVVFDVPERQQCSGVNMKQCEFEH